jgi:hypothetical protein
MRILFSQEHHFVYETKTNWMTSKPQSVVITEKAFNVSGPGEREIVAEIFYDPLFYDLELIIQSQTQVRTNFQQTRGIEEHSFKGAKKIFVKLEPGDYSFKVVAKVPAGDAETKKYVPSYLEFQLFLSEGSELEAQYQGTQSLNYFGMIGPEGKDYGQYVHLIKDLELKPRERQTIEFFLTKSKGMTPNIDIQAIETSGDSEQIDLSIDAIQAENASIAIRPHVSKYFDDLEDASAYEALMTSDLQSGQHYRIVIMNRDSSSSMNIQVKLVITEDTSNG